MPSARPMVTLIAGAGVLGAAARFLPDDSAIGWLLRVIGASAAVLIVPGALTVLAWRPRHRLGVIDLLAIGVGVSCGLIQLLTVGALLLHWSPVASLSLLAAWAIAHAAVGARATERVAIGFSWAAAAMMLVLAGLAIFLYTVGSPFSEGEERVHVAIIERLMHLPSPALDTIYFAPRVVYTYPFPGTHYLLALIGRLGDVDALFLYHKMRAVWGVLAVLLLFSCTRALTGSERIGFVSGFVAAALILNGAWGPVPGLYWAQMAPYSHASDVAMGVLLPALLLLTFEYLGAAAPRERRFFFIAALAMAFMMIITHAREIVQLFVYLIAFAVALLLKRDGRPLAVRAVILAVAVAAIFGVYLVWHNMVVLIVDTVAGKKQDLRDLWRSASLLDLVKFPLPLLRNYIPAFGPMFLGLNPTVLLLSPVVLLALRGRALLWLVGASIASYALIIRFPLFGIPYIYLTYFEMLYSPFRNWMFFIYALTGVTIYLAAARLARWGYAASVGLALLISGGLAWTYARFEPFLTKHPDWFFLPLLVAYAIAIAWLWLRRDRPINERWVDEPGRPWAVALIVLVVPLVVITTVRESSVATMNWARSRQTPAAMLADEVCDGSHEFCPPPRALIELAHSSVPPEAVFAIDNREEWAASLFMPQQMLMWPGRLDALYDPEELFPAYYRHLQRTREAYDAQPLFNDRETRAERVAFLRDLGVTHVLVNPRTHDLMTGVLRGEPDLFRQRYDDGRWALYEVSAGN